MHLLKIERGHFRLQYECCSTKSRSATCSIPTTARYPKKTCMRAMPRNKTTRLCFANCQENAVRRKTQATAMTSDASVAVEWSPCIM